MTYDQWKTTDPRDGMPEDDREDGCTCLHVTDRDCPLHGEDPDAAQERARDDIE